MRDFIRSLAGAVAIAVLSWIGFAACNENDRVSSGSPMPVASKALVVEAVENLRVVEVQPSLCFAVTGAVVSGAGPVLQVVLVPCPNPDPPCRAERAP